MLLGKHCQREILPIQTIDVKNIEYRILTIDMFKHRTIDAQLYCSARQNQKEASYVSQGYRTRRTGLTTRVQAQPQSLYSQFPPSRRGGRKARDAIRGILTWFLILGRGRAEDVAAGVARKSWSLLGVRTASQGTELQKPLMYSTIYYSK